MKTILYICLMLFFCLSGNSYAGLHNYWVGTGAAFADNAKQEFTTGKSVGCWFMIPSTTTGSNFSLVSKGGVGGGWSLRVRSFNDKLRYYAYDAETDILGNFYTSAVVNDGVWHFALMKIVGTTMTGYLDGVYQGTDTNADFGGCTNNGGLSICNVGDGAGAYYYIGSVMIYNSTDNSYIHNINGFGDTTALPIINIDSFIPLWEDTGNTVVDILNNVTATFGANISWSGIQPVIIYLGE